jgi:hypothetical protein
LTAMTCGLLDRPAGHVERQHVAQRRQQRRHRARTAHDDQRQPRRVGLLAQHWHAFASAPWSRYCQDATHAQPAWDAAGFSLRYGRGGSMASPQRTPDGHESKEGRTAARWAAVSALAALAAVAVAILAYMGQLKSNKTADEGLDLARKNEARLDRADADDVTLGGAPPSIADKHPLPPSVSIWYVVYNATNNPIENVWVSDGHGGSIRISGIEPCTMYALDADFGPKDLYFSDANGLYWHRKYGDQLERLSRADFPPMPDPDTGDSPWLAQVSDCSSG